MAIKMSEKQVAQYLEKQKPEDIKAVLKLLEKILKEQESWQNLLCGAIKLLQEIKRLNEN